MVAVAAGLAGAVPPCWLVWGRLAGCVVWLVVCGLVVVVGAAALLPDRSVEVSADEVG